MMPTGDKIKRACAPSDTGICRLGRTEWYRPGYPRQRLIAVVGLVSALKMA